MGRFVWETNLNLGGVITHVTPSNSHENIINSHDGGSPGANVLLFAANAVRSKRQTTPLNLAFLGSNPIQSGDCFGNRSRVVAHENDENNPSARPWRKSAPIAKTRPSGTTVMWDRGASFVPKYLLFIPFFH